jgi:2-C-methyl-D-erythritol 4-phosphate cytidylyltransferase
MCFPSQYTAFTHDANRVLITANILKSPWIDHCHLGSAVKKVAARVTLVCKLTGTTWGVDAET